MAKTKSKFNAHLNRKINSPKSIREPRRCESSNPFFRLSAAVFIFNLWFLCFWHRPGAASHLHPLSVSLPNGLAKAEKGFRRNFSALKVKYLHTTSGGKSIILNTDDWSWYPINFSNHPESTYASQRVVYDNRSVCGFAKVEAANPKGSGVGLAGWMRRGSSPFSL